MTRAISVKQICQLFCAILACLATSAVPSACQTFKSLLSFNTSMATPSEAVVLIQGRDGGLYGTTARGGDNEVGTIFRVKPGVGLQRLYSFCAQNNCADGSYPNAGLVLGTDGNFYGTTYQGGTANSGVVFKFSPAGKYTVLYSFCNEANCPDGAYPEAKLVEGIDGNFYGTTFWAGANANESLYDDGGGTVFKITPDGKLTTLYSFCAQPDCTDGDSSTGGLVQATDGNFYGTTTAGGASGACTGGCGAIFRITPSGTLTTLYSFCSQTDCIDGSYPFSGVIEANDGNFYGTTVNGGQYIFGSAFQFKPSGEFESIYSFCYEAGCPDGVDPHAGLTQATDGKLYGATDLFVLNECNGGGNYRCGTLFSLTTAGSLTTLYTFCPNAQKEFPGVDCPQGTFPGGLFQATDGNFYGITVAGGNHQLGTLFSLSTGLSRFVSFVLPAGRVNQTAQILGLDLTGTTAVTLNGTPMNFTVVSDTFLKATVPPGATTGYVTVTTPGGTLTSNVPFQVLK
jgi:uncharacterized repeat protein (TIGR03803 family)